VAQVAVNSAPPSSRFVTERVSHASGQLPERSMDALVRTGPRVIAVPDRPRVSLGSAYVKSQIVAALSTLTDFACMVFLVEVAHIHYVASTALGLLAGGATAFLSNRHWSFRATHRQCGGQVLRYALVWLGSLVLTCAGVYVMTDHAGLPYTLSKLFAAIGVGACFNFPMHRFYVFR
jgi:putative flippase GtrA